MNTLTTIGLVVVIAYMLSKSKNTKENISLTTEQIYDSVVSEAESTIEDLESIIAADPELATEIYNTIIDMIEKEISTNGTIDGTTEKIKVIVSDIVSEVEAAVENNKSVENTAALNTKAVADAFITDATKLPFNSEWKQLYNTGSGWKSKLYTVIPEDLVSHVAMQTSWRGGDFQIKYKFEWLFPGDTKINFITTDGFPGKNEIIPGKIKKGTIIMLTFEHLWGDSGEFKVGVFGY